MTATCRWTTSPTWPSRTRTDRARATDQDCDEGAPQGPFFHAAGERPATPIFRLHGSGAAHIRPPTRAADDASRTSGGAIAQLVERLNGIQEVRGSTPLGSTSIAACFRLQTAAWPAPSGSRPTVCPRRIVALPTVLDGTLRGCRLSGSAASSPLRSSASLSAGHPSGCASAGPFASLKNAATSACSPVWAGSASEKSSRSPASNRSRGRAFSFCVSVNQRAP